jgi:hypothetical protein
MHFKQTTDGVSNNAESRLRLKLGETRRECQCSQMMILALEITLTFRKQS